MAAKQHQYEDFLVDPHTGIIQGSNSPEMAEEFEFPDSQSSFVGMGILKIDDSDVDDELSPALVPCENYNEFIKFAQRQWRQARRDFWIDELGFSATDHEVVRDLSQLHPDIR